jgi:diacylglycerol O-acyltransferase / wax synthase
MIWTAHDRRPAPLRVSGLRATVPVMLQRLTAEDTRILSLESEAIVGHTCKVLIAERRCDDVVGALRRHVLERVGLAPQLGFRLLPTPWHLAPPAWVDDPAVDPAGQIRWVGRRAPLARVELPELVADLMATRLDRSRPLWQLDVAELEGDLVAAIWRVHHALADGAASLAFGETGVWDDVPDPAPPTVQAPRPGPVPSAFELLATAMAEHAQNAASAVSRAAEALVSRAHWREVARELAAARPTLGRELARAGADSPLDATIGRRRRVAFVDMELDEIRATAHAFDGVTVNDVVLAMIAGSLRRWLELRHAHHDGIGPPPMRIQVPVSLHTPGDRQANRDSFLNVDLPVGEPDPVRRLLAVNEETRDRKAHHDAEELYALFADLAHLSKHLYRRAYEAASDPHVFALSISNVRGPAESRYLAGGRILEFYSLAEVAPRHALRLSAWSFSGRFSFGLCADADALPDLDPIALGLTASLSELRAVV